MAKVALHKKRQGLARLTGSLLIAILPMISVAQPATPIEQSQTNADKDLQSVSSDTPKTAPKAKENTVTPPVEKQQQVSNKRFKPSERISEDLSVAFPVDI